MLSGNMPVDSYLLKKYWIDIGLIEDFKNTIVGYDKYFRGHE